MESYAKVVIEFRKAGLVVSCEDIGKEIFIPRSTDSDKSPINKLVDFINKKAERLARHHSSISTVDVTLKVVKPETAMNKQAIVKISVPQHEDLVADKTADTFEEAIDLTLEAIDRQLTRFKEKK